MTFFHFIDVLLYLLSSAHVTLDPLSVVAFFNVIIYSWGEKNNQQFYIVLLVFILKH